MSEWEQVQYLVESLKAEKRLLEQKINEHGFRMTCSDIIYGCNVQCPHTFGHVVKGIPLIGETERRRWVGPELENKIKTPVGVRLSDGLRDFYLL